MSDLVNVNDIEFQTLDDGNDVYHDDVVVEAMIEVAGQGFTQHAEGPSETDPKKVFAVPLGTR